MKTWVSRTRASRGVGDQYLMVYTGYASGDKQNRVRIILATSTDLVHWKKHGMLRGDFNTIDNKNGMLFEPVAGQNRGGCCIVRWKARVR